MGALLGVLVVLLVVFAIVALVGVLIHTIHQAFSPGTNGPNLGAGALIAAPLSSLFVIWGTWLKHRTVTVQKEGHITDRINKAVATLAPALRGRRDAFGHQILDEPRGELGAAADAGLGIDV